LVLGRPIPPESLLDVEHSLRRFADELASIGRILVEIAIQDVRHGIGGCLMRIPVEIGGLSQEIEVVEA